MKKKWEISEIFSGYVFTRKILDDFQGLPLLL